jgi:hypothetical protein
MLYFIIITAYIISEKGFIFRRAKAIAFKLRTAPTPSQKLPS